MDQEFVSKLKKATKWSTITEVAARLVTPISSMVLARLLTPEAFGVVATLTMIISFAEIFTDAGFQKYLIQHEFKDETDRKQCTNVAFWSNLVMSLAIWALIVMFREPIATMVGNSGLGYVIAIACVSIPLAAFSSIQIALYKRDFDFKTLFKVRIVGVLIPIVITIPLAIILKSFWALLIGIILKDVVNALLLTYYSKWKPSLYYNFSQLKEMFAFTFWTMLETLSIWGANYLDVFIVGIVLSTYYLGIYKTTMTTVSQISGLITASITPVIFSTLSRLQNDSESFKKMFLKFQKLLGLFMLPLGIGFLFYNKLVTNILLGSQWNEAAPFIGLYGWTMSLQVVFSYTCSEGYRSIGKPKLSLFVQICFIATLIPTIYIAVTKGYEMLYICRSLTNFSMIIANLIVMYVVLKISFFKMLIQLKYIIASSLLMGICIFFSIQYLEGIIGYIVSILLASIIYIGFLTLISKRERNDILTILGGVKKQK